MDWLLPNLLYYLVVPGICYVFLCRYCDGIGSVWKGIGYVLCACLLFYGEYRLQISEVLSFPLELMLLAWFGCWTVSVRYTRSLTFSALILSVLQVCQGILYFAGHYLVDRLAVRYLFVMKYMDMAVWMVFVPVFVCVLVWILRDFVPQIPKTEHLSLLMLLVPVLFICLTERVIRAQMYGNTLVWDSEAGIVFPVVNHWEVLFLQAAAALCLFTVLAAFRRLMKTVDTEQKYKQLEQQTNVQKIYLGEARAREQMTRAFRHDVKNHLQVVRGLLEKNQIEQAQQYLEHLGGLSAALTYPVHTGNAAVDALLGSKLAAAAQQEIPIDCTLHIPEQTKVEDIDWCILLSNALDNAICANAALEKRWIEISGRQKGNFYLLRVNNPCTREDGALPADGIGLSNMRTVAQKYGGTLQIEIAQGIFHLEVLLLISQP